ncbi:retrovirus-related pol polyprotein from transposon TNT 1-94 [Tanacetum coccineum]
MDLCGPMSIESINGKKYILVIVDDYSRFTWVKLLRLKDEAPEFIIKFLKMIQVRLNATVRNIRTNNGTEFNGVVERQNWTLVEAAGSMLIYANAPLFLWAEAVATAYSENLGKLKAKADVGIFIGYAPAKKAYRIYNRRPALHEMTLGTLSSGLVPQPSSSTHFVPPTSNDWDTPLQPLFDEYFSPPPCVDHLVPEVVALEPAVLTGSPSSTTID